jgi:hypothetical protein
MTEEARRLEECREGLHPWRKWGPYLSERQWGTVREDYSTDGNAWDYFSHDQARSRTYRWGEDGIAGLSDDRQRLCFALALWNGCDPIVKERMFGLTNSEGNHGEDVKEYYFYLDSTPTHSYMKYLYKYPQAAYPYDAIVSANRRRTRHDPEFELLETGVFDDDRYFDVFVEYAKAAPEDILLRLTIANRGRGPATLHLLPTLWFRNTWALDDTSPKPSLRAGGADDGQVVLHAWHPEIGDRYLCCEGSPAPLFTDNETNRARIFGQPNPSPWVKDAFDRYLVHGEQGAVNPERTGTKAAAHYRIGVPGHASMEIRLRLTPEAPGADARDSFRHFDRLFQLRQREADEFYASIIPAGIGADRTLVMRQALAGMLWTKQFYYYDLPAWLREHGVDPADPSRRSRATRNVAWPHMLNADVISMPDKWEYPWYAAWDLAFHVAALSIVDRDFAKGQLLLMLDHAYQHPNGQLPAYEWNFGDVNPPVHAWAAWWLYQGERSARGQGDIAFLEQMFQRLLVNFTWWVNRKDPRGENVFEGGFLGLDNIGVFDRSAPLPTGGHLEQADGTAWMAFYSQTMLQLALELACHLPVYQDLAAKFYEHFVWIAAAMDRIGDHRDELWDEEDGFFYDVLSLPDGSAVRLKVRSMVGLLPLCASTVFPTGYEQKLPRLAERIRAFNATHPDLITNIAPPGRKGRGGRHLLSVMSDAKLRRVLARMLDEEEFLSPYGLRALSRCHRDYPYTFTVGRDVYRVDYEPGESTSGLFGGNSNWRGPVWLPVNALVIRALVNLYAFHGDEFTVECPTRSGVRMTLLEVARELARRLMSLFLRTGAGVRPVHGAAAKFQQDPHWRELILFFEYFHGDDGRGLGASHQTGWTGVIANLIEIFAALDTPGSTATAGLEPTARAGTA